MIITPQGDLDIASVDAFRATLATALDQTGGVIVDLSDIDFLDSSGLGAIVEASEQLRGQGRELAVVAPRGTTAAVLLTLARLRRRLAVFETRRAALRR